MALTRENLRQLEVKRQEFPATRALIKALAEKFNIQPKNQVVAEYITGYFIPALLEPTNQKYNRCGFVADDQKEILYFLAHEGRRLHLRALAEAYLQTSTNNFHEKNVNELYKHPSPILKENDEDKDNDSLYKLGLLIEENKSANKPISNAEIAKTLGDDISKKILKASLIIGYYQGSLQDMDLIYNRWKDSPLNRSDFQEDLTRDPPQLREENHSPPRDSKIRVEDHNDNKHTPLKTIPQFDPHKFFNQINEKRIKRHTEELSWDDILSAFKSVDGKLAEEIKPGDRTQAYDFSEFQKLKKKLPADKVDDLQKLFTDNPGLSKGMIEHLDLKLAWLLQDEKPKHGR